MDKVELIRQEVERLKESGCASPIVICDTLLSFIDSLQEEPMKIRKCCKYRCKNDMRNNDTGKISFIGGKIYYAPEDDMLVSEENGWRCDTSEDASNFELVEEPVSDDLEDEYNNYIDIHDGEWTKDDYLAFARHFANWGSKHHKPIGEDFEKVVSDFLDQYTYPREEVDFLQFALYINSWAREQISKHYYLNTQDLDIAAEKCEESWVKVGIEPQKKGDYVSIFKAGAKWGKNQAMAEIQAQSMALAHGCPKENTSNELKVAADNALESISDKYDIISVGSCLEMFRLGANWQKQQMMEDAVDGRFSYNPNFKENEFICLEKSDTPEHYLGELVKVIIIKQKEE